MSPGPRDAPGPGIPDPVAARRWERFVAPFVALWYRPILQGTERLPVERPYMLVSNHSGLGLAEIMVLAVRLLIKFGPTRPLAAMVHPIALSGWPAGGWMRRLGAIPSTYEAAEAALASGVPVLVFPGGDHEAARPIWEANDVQFAGRKGFLKIARRAGVPIVPMGIRGSHFTAPILARSERILRYGLIIPWLTGVKRTPLTLAGVLGALALIATGPLVSWWLTVALAWIWVASPLSYVPFVPWRIKIQIGTPIEPEQLFPSGQDTEDLDHAYGLVQSKVRELMKQARTLTS